MAMSVHAVHSLLYGELLCIHAARRHHGSSHDKVLVSNFSHTLIIIIWVINF